MPPEAPVRLCCGQRHWTVSCPDGLTMCCLCFSRFPVEKLWTDEEGTWDVCIPCESANQEYRKAHPERYDPGP